MAHVVLKREKIPAIIRADMVDDLDARFFNLAENLQREDLNILQEALALEKLKALGVTETDAADRLGKSRGWVQIRYMLLSLPKEIHTEAALGNITQTQIRELYSIYKKGGQEAAFQAVRDIKEAKARGRTNVSVNPNKNKPNVKRQRSRAEIFDLMEHIQNSGIGNGIWTRCLAWAAGEITTLDVYDSLAEYAQKNDVNYIKPEMKEYVADG
jgi:ParB family chromosome partitioning protein